MPIFSRNLLSNLIFFKFRGGEACPKIRLVLRISQSVLCTPCTPCHFCIYHSGVPLAKIFNPAPAAVRSTDSLCQINFSSDQPNSLLRSDNCQSDIDLLFSPLQFCYNQNVVTILQNSYFFHCS